MGAISVLTGQISSTIWCFLEYTCQLHQLLCAYPWIKLAVARMNAFDYLFKDDKKKRSDIPWKEYPVSIKPMRKYVYFSTASIARSLAPNPNYKKILWPTEIHSLLDELPKKQWRI